MNRFNKAFNQLLSKEAATADTSNLTDSLTKYHAPALSEYNNRQDGYSLTSKYRPYNAQDYAPGGKLSAEVLTPKQYSDEQRGQHEAVQDAVTAELNYVERLKKAFAEQAAKARAAQQPVAKPVQPLPPGPTNADMTQQQIMPGVKPKSGFVNLNKKR